MTHASRAAADLRAAITRPLEGVGAAIEQFNDALQAEREADDVEDVLRAVASLTLALEWLHKRAKEAEEICRDAAAQSMVDIGCPTLRTSSHTISLVTGGRRAICTNRDLVPPELWSDPQPKPNTVEAARRLRAKQPAPGFVLTNSPPHITIRNRDAA